MPAVEKNKELMGTIDPMISLFYQHPTHLGELYDNMKISATKQYCMIIGKILYRNSITRVV